MRLLRYVLVHWGEARRDGGGMLVPRRGHVDDWRAALMFALSHDA